MCKRHAFILRKLQIEKSKDFNYKVYLMIFKYSRLPALSGSNIKCYQSYLFQLLCFKSKSLVRQWTKIIILLVVKIDIWRSSSCWNSFNVSIISTWLKEIICCIAKHICNLLIIFVDFVQIWVILSIKSWFWVSSPMLW